MKVATSASDRQQPRGQALVRAAAAVLAARAHGNQQDPFAFLTKRTETEDDLARATLQRAVTLPATTGGSGWADVLAAQEVGAFLASLTPYSAASALIGMGLRVTLLGHAQSELPRRAAGPSAAPWVAEGDPIAVRDATLDAVTIGPVKKIGAITVMSRELARRPNDSRTFETMLREDAGAGLDAAYFSADATSSEGVAGLLYGLTALVPVSTWWSGADAMRADLATLAAEVGAGGSGEVVFVMGTGRAAKARVLAPDLAGSILASPSVAETRVIAVDPLALVHASSPNPELEASPHAVVHMDDSPAEIVSGTGPATAAPVASMWQTGLMALRMTLEIAFVKRTSTAVAFMDGLDPEAG